MLLPFYKFQISLLLYYLLHTFLLFKIDNIKKYISWVIKQEQKAI